MEFKLKYGNNFSLVNGLQTFTQGTEDIYYDLNIIV